MGFIFNFDNFKKGKKKVNPFDLVDDFDYDFAPFCKQFNINPPGISFCRRYIKDCPPFGRNSSGTISFLPDYYRFNSYICSINLYFK